MVVQGSESHEDCVKHKISASNKIVHNGQIAVMHDDVSLHRISVVVR